VVWAGILQEIGRLQDALPNLPAAPTSVRLADFEALGWLLAKIDGTEADWEAAMIRLEAAQAGFALEDEVLFPILQKLLESGNLADQSTGEFYRAVTKVAAELGLVPPGDAARCSRSLKALKELLEQRLDIRIWMRLLNGHTHIEVRRGPTWARTEVTEVTLIQTSSKNVGEEGSGGVGLPDAHLAHLKEPNVGDQSDQETA
jgi:hypothetical protein